MTKSEVLDLYFLAARRDLVELAALLDRVDRAGGAEDYRIEALRHAINALGSGEEGRAAEVLNRLSDPTIEPVEAAGSKGAAGAWPGPGRVGANRTDEAGR